MDIVRYHPRLRTRAGDRSLPDCVKGNGRQGNGFLFTDRKEHVHLPFVRLRMEGLGIGHKAVGDTASCGNHDNHLVAFIAGGLDAFGHLADPVKVLDRGSSVFLYNKCHKLDILAESLGEIGNSQEKRFFQEGFLLLQTLRCSDHRSLRTEVRGQDQVG